MFFQKVSLIKRLELPDDINNLILCNYKYMVLNETKYKKNYTDVIQHLNHYIFLNKKLNRKENTKYPLLKTILYFDI